MDNNLLKYLTKEEFYSIKNEKYLYRKTYYLVSILFKDRVDKNNKPYINHLIRVSVRMNTIEGRIAGLLHDIVEDIEDITFEDLSDIGIPNSIIEVLKLVTKEKQSKMISKSKKLKLYNEEINNIINSNNKIAIDLKYNDMFDNYSRIKYLNKKEQEWLELKYKDNIKKLKKAKENYNDRY